MLHNVAFTALHVAVHVLLYALPRTVWAVCVRWPAQALCAVLGVPRAGWCGDGPCEERRVRLLGPVGRVASSAAATARERLGVAEAQLANPALHHNAATAAAVAVDDAVAPAWLRYAGPLYGGHVHTILGAYRPLLDLRAPQREVVRSYDGNPTCLDWWLPTPAETAAAAAACATAEGMRVRALVVILPGLTGSSKEFYVRRMARQLLAANMAVCVLNARGVADTPLEKPQLFSAVFTKDLRYMMENYFTREVVQQHLFGDGSHSPVTLFGLGFSLGGLILSNYVSEQGEANKESGFDAVYTVTSPHNVNDGAIALSRFPNRIIYGPVLFGGLRNYCLRHINVVKNFPGIDAHILFDRPRCLFDRLRTVQDFDQYITAPHFGFPCAEAYYSYANNFRRLHHSRTPQVCLVAANDPICGAPQPDPLWLGVIEKHRGGLVYVEMPVGGHLGFLGCPWHEWMQAPSEMEKFVVYSMTHFIESAGCNFESNGESNAVTTLRKTRPKRFVGTSKKGKAH